MGEATAIDQLLRPHLRQEVRDGLVPPDQLAEGRALLRVGQ